MQCKRCGVLCDDGEFDEDSGDFLCPVCVAETTSCGCGDPLDMDSEDSVNEYD